MPHVPRLPRDTACRVPASQYVALTLSSTSAAKIAQKTRPPPGRNDKNLKLAAPARAAATAAAVATAVAGHDAAAEAAGGSVAEVDEAGQGVGGVN